MYEQRVPTDRTDRQVTDRPWFPDVLPEGFEFTKLDAYVVVDELLDGVAVLATSYWPLLDQAGRLSFANEGGSTYGIDASHLQARLNEQRGAILETTEMDAALVDRPLRIGDTFLIRNIAEGDPGAWEMVVDVTPQARDAAKIALYGAVAPKLSEEEAQVRDRVALPLEEEEEEGAPPPSTGGTSGAAPAV